VNLIQNSEIKIIVGAEIAAIEIKNSMFYSCGR